MKLVDTHVHLDDAAYDADRPAVIARMLQAGVTRAVDVGCDVASSRAALALANRYDCLYAAVGVHPHEAQGVSVAFPDQLAEMSKDPRVVAMGEIGLDYHYDLSPREVQKRVFEQQLELASSLSLPVIIHTREATQDTLGILKAHERELKNGGIIHCYTGSRESAEAYLQLGFHLAFGGAVTFKNANKEGVVRAVPRERLLLETDCPYQTPVPFRGQRNEPMHLVRVCERVQEWLDFDVAEATRRNAEALFGWQKGEEDESDRL